MTSNKEPSGGFWTYEVALSEQSVIPSVEELYQSWEAYHDTTANEVSFNETMFGTCELPETQPTAVLSLDLCEVVRQTGISVTRIYGHDDTEHLSDYASYYGKHLLGENYLHKQSVLIPLLMNLDRVPPVPYADAITAFMQRWRNHGVYIIANTSTLPGAEVSTVRHLAKHHPHTTRGVLFPRNHDGNGAVTKAQILQYTARKIQAHTGYNLTDIPYIAIEDSVHHAQAYTASTLPIHTFMPAYSWNEVVEHESDITRVAQEVGTLSSFIIVDNYLAAHGIVK